MNTESEATETTISKAKSKNVYLRVGRETKKKILSELAILNRKSLGKAITPDQYVGLGISLIGPEHLETLKNQSLTNKDRLEQKYREYCAEKGRISMDEFLGVLLGEKS